MPGLKLCQGQISLYFPILHRDMAPRNPIRSHVTPALVKEKLNRILEIDYSAFHREINYRDPSKGIEKELVMMLNNEAKGNPRLNKVSRGILFKHCPFSKGIREQLERQPMYIDMITQMKNLRAKQARELENHYKHYLKANGTLDTILENNLEFYRDM